ncbi:DNA repair protein rhp57 [Apiospora aurea]|uniref:DNA repair protein rhp57 n=1 Tax=Apiospora aurea TaxID=335848 RepID=A0ABR1QUB9_9PEZI
MPPATRQTEEPIDLGNNVFLYQPATIISPHDANTSALPAAEADLETPPPPPRLIILCTWLGGVTTPRVNKYVAGYQALYPTAHLLLIRTVFLDISVRTFATLRAHLQPVRDAISRIMEQHPNGDGLNSGGGGADGADGILLHIFSHGGCNCALQLAWSMGSSPSSQLFCDNLRLVVFDCCPGGASFGKAYNAAIVSLPQTTRFLGVRSLGAPLVYAAVAAVHGLQSAGLMRSVRELRRELNDPVAFRARAGRLHLYSRADEMVAAEDVLAHAREAEAGLGCAVGTVGFEEAAHCALVREDAQRYWGAVKDGWARKDPTRPAAGADMHSLPRL